MAEIKYKGNGVTAALSFCSDQNYSGIQLLQKKKIRTNWTLSNSYQSRRNPRGTLAHVVQQKGAI